MRTLVSRRRRRRGERSAGGSTPVAPRRGGDALVVHAGDLDLSAARAVAARHVREGALPSIVFGVADPGGIRGLFAVGGRRSPVRQDSIFFLASVTKAIVATAVMQYVDEGRLDLHAPMAMYLPRFTGSGRDAVTAWHVLTHTSGLPDTGLDDLRRERPSYARSLEDVLARSPAWEPGSRFEYNSSAWLLLSAAIATLSAMSFPEALRVRLLQPLGMRDTTFDPRFARRRIVRMQGYGIGSRLFEEVLLRFLVRATLPGGGLFGTVPDLLRFGQALMPGSPRRDGTGSSARILSSRAIEEMSRLQTAGIPHIDADGQETFVPQALGWRKAGVPWPDRPAAITHGGISGSRLWVDLEQGLVFAFLTNRWQAPDDAAVAVLEEVYRAVESLRGGAPSSDRSLGGD